MEILFRMQPATFSGVYCTVLPDVWGQHQQILIKLFYLRFGALISACAMVPLVTMHHKGEEPQLEEIATVT